MTDYDDDKGYHGSGNEQIIMLQFNRAGWSVQCY